MKTFLFFTFLVSLAKAGLWVCIGHLIKNQFETTISAIIRRPLTDNLIEKDNQETFNRITNWIGILIIIIGIGVAISALITLIMGFKMPTNNFNFKF